MNVSPARLPTGSIVLTALVMLAVCGHASSAAAGLPLAQGATALLAPPLEEAGKAPPRPSMQGVPGAQMGQNFMNAPNSPPAGANAAGGAAPAGAVSTPKYYFSYLLMLLVMGLGIYITCKPTRRTSLD